MHLETSSEHRSLINKARAIFVTICLFFWTSPIGKRTVSRGPQGRNKAIKISRVFYLIYNENIKVFSNIKVFQNDTLNVPGGVKRYPLSPALTFSLF